MERGHLRCPGGRRSPFRCEQRSPLHRRYARCSPDARRLVVLRRVFRDLTAARIIVPVMSAASPAPDAAGFARHFSLEATRPGAAEIATLADTLPRGTPLYLTAVPTQDTHELVAAAAGVRTAGLEPVAHIAARRIAGASLLQELLTRLRGEADMRRLLLIGGDVDAPGAFPDALAVLQRGGLREAGIEEIGIGAYPEGHPRIPAGRLESALDEKIAAATAQGLRVHIVSQFSFSPERILAWLKTLRACGMRSGAALLLHCAGWRRASAAVWLAMSALVSLSRRFRRRAVWAMWRR